MNQASEKLLLRALKGERTERPPIWLLRQAGRYLPEYLATRAAADGMLNLCNSPEHAAEVTLQPIRRFHLDGAILVSEGQRVGRVTDAATLLRDTLARCERALPPADPLTEAVRTSLAQRTG